MRMTTEFRSEIYQAAQTKAMKVTLYEIGLLIGLMYLADKAAIRWFQYADAALAAVMGFWVYLAFEAWRSWRSLVFLERALDADAAKPEEIVSDDYQ